MLQSIWEWIADERFRVATVVGLATVPLTVLLSVGPVSGATASLTGVPFLLGCLFVGYEYRDRTTISWRAGYRTGLVGSLGPVIAGLYRAGPELWTATPWWFRALAGVTIVAAVPFFGLVGALFAPLGEKVAEIIDHDRLPVDDA